MLLALALVLGSGSVPGLAPPDGAAEFAEELQALEQLVAAGRGEKARPRLAALLEAHREARYVFPRSLELRELHAECAFQAWYDAPEPDDLISGELVRWKPSSGKIEVVYRENERARRFLDLGDFLRTEDGDRFHPLHFEGAYQMEIRGRMPERTSSAPYFMLGFDEDVSYAAVFGLPRQTSGMYVRWTPARLIRVEDGYSQVLDEDDTAPIDLGEKYSIKVSVGTKSISAYCNGRKFLSGKKPKDVFGNVGFGACHDVHSITLKGTCSGSWIQGLVSAHREEAREEFFEGYDAEAALPDWLRAGPPTVAASHAVEAAFPGAPMDGYGEILERIDGFLARGQLEKGLAYVGTLTSARVTPVFKAYYQALFCERHGRYDEAVRHCETGMFADPDSTHVKLLYARILIGTGEYDEAQELLGIVREHLPLHPEVHRLSASIDLRRGRPREAKRQVDEAILAGVPASELEDINGTLVRALKGPTWSDAHEYKTRHYHVRSDLDSKTCFEAGQVLEESLRLYHKSFGRLQDYDNEERYFRVYVFSGHAGYLAHSADLFGRASENSAGLYSPWLKQLLIWNLRDRDAMWRTVRHEGFHQYFDSLLPVTPPLWLNEGLAEYFETMEVQRGRMRAGAPHPSHVALLSTRRGDWVPARDFLRTTPGQFMARASWNYPQAWLVAHWLMEGGPEPKAYLDDLLERLKGGEAWKTAVEAVFGGRYDEVDAALVKHLGSL